MRLYGLKPWDLAHLTRRELDALWADLNRSDEGDS